MVPKLQPKHLDIIHVPVLVTFGSFRFHFFSIQGEIPPTYPTLISLGTPYANTAMELAPRDCCMILFAWNIYRALCEKKPSFILLLQISTNQIKLTCRYSKKFLLFQYFLLIQFKPCLCVCVRWILYSFQYFFHWCQYPWLTFVGALGAFLRLLQHSKHGVIGPCTFILSLFSIDLHHAWCLQAEFSTRTKSVWIHLVKKSIEQNPLNNRAMWCCFIL